MNIAVLQHNLFAALKNLSSAINPRSNPPILAYALFRTNSDTSCEIAGTDLETTQVVRVGCKVDRHFAALVDFETLLDVVSLMRKQERIDITYDERMNILHVIQGRNHNRLNCYANIEDFPSLPSPEMLNDAELIATIEDVRGMKESVAHVSQFTTRDMPYLRLDARPEAYPREALKIAGAGAYALSTATIEARVQIASNLIVYAPSRAFQKALEALAADDTAEAITRRGQRIGGLPFELSWLESSKMLVLRNSTRTILIRCEESASFAPPEYEVVASVPLMEQKRLVSLFKVGKRTRANKFTIRTDADEPGKLIFECAGITAFCDAGEWESPDGERLDVSAQIELKGETVAAFERAVAFRRDPKSMDYDMTLLLARRGEDWLVGVCGNGSKDVMIAAGADVDFGYESEMMRGLS